MRTVTNLFLLNMAVSDILSTVFGIPALLAREISPAFWPLGGFMCRATRVISSISRVGLNLHYGGPSIGKVSNQRTLGGYDYCA